MTLFSYKDGDLQIRHTIDLTPTPEKFELHAHRDCELYYFISGNGYYTVEGNDYELIPGCLLAMRDGETHTLHIRPDKPYERICINFSPDTLPLLKEQVSALFHDRPLGKNNRFIVSEDSSRFIADCMARICCEVTEGNQREQALVGLMCVLWEMYRLKDETVTSVETAPIPSHIQGSAETVAKIIEYINNNLTLIKNLDVLEQEFFFSKSYINRIFKESTGSSVWDYIVLKRLLLARTLLQEGKQANIVASECGFCDYSSFYRQFKQRFGISPLSARKNKH